jgi:hypothetical protein
LTRRAGLHALKSVEKGETIQPLLCLNWVEFAVDQNTDVTHLRAKADKYRMLARWVTDRKTAASIMELTRELEQQASSMEKPSEDEIRKRAQEIWEQNRRPTGRDDEFWHQAERELREAMEVGESRR